MHLVCLAAQSPQSDTSKAHLPDATADSFLRYQYTMLVLLAGIGGGGGGGTSVEKPSKRLMKITG
jgi:hypothetical protein